MDLQIAKAKELRDLEVFYRITQYGGSVSPADRVVYVTEGKRIIGAGRLSRKENVFVLRGMRVLKEHRGLGIGSAILDALISEAENHICYCIPYSYLRGFYAQRGFDEIEPQEAPTERVHDHLHQRETEADQATANHRWYVRRRVYPKECRPNLVAPK